MAKNSTEISFDKKLTNVYQTYGLREFLAVASGVLNAKESKDFEKKMRINGEVCEVVLRVMTEHYLAKHNLLGATFHSAILKDRNSSNPDFCTELDFTMLSPYFAVTGECKSFVGNITISDECTLTRGKLVADVARQSHLHGRCLKQYLAGISLPNTGLVEPPMGLFCFLYCNGTVTDTRGKKERAAIPIVTIQNLFKYYDLAFEQHRKKVYDFDEGVRLFKALSTSQKLHDQHKAFLGY